MAFDLGPHRARAGPLVDAAMRSIADHPYYARDSAEVAELAALPDDEFRSAILVLFDVAAASPESAPAHRRLLNRVRSEAWAEFLGAGLGPQVNPAIGVLNALRSRRATWSRAEAAFLVGRAGAILLHTKRAFDWLAAPVVGRAVTAAEKAVAAGGLGELEAPVRGLVDGLGLVDQYARTETARYRARLLALLQEAGPAIDPELFDASDTWGRDWAARAPALPATQQSLITSLALLSSVTPSRAWRDRVRPLAIEPGADGLVHQMLAEALEARSLQQATTVTYGDTQYVTQPPAIGDRNVVIIRGAVWAASMTSGTWVPDILAEIGIHFGTSGTSSNEARDQRLANAAAAALGSLDSTAAFAALGRMKAKVTNRNVSKQIAGALDAAAARAGLSASEILELGVPTTGLGPDGLRTSQIDGHEAVFALAGSDATLSWRTPDGAATARPPKALAEAHRAAVERSNAELKDLRRAVGVERGRIEDLFVEGRSWPFAAWRERYLEHPLTRAVSQRLIWEFSAEGRTTSAVADADGLTTADGRPYQPEPSVVVTLWHPIAASEDEVAAWRAAILARQIRQPFKQAFREVYRLTPAERDTGIYSNRFAAHILRYPQARALMTARRWGSNFLGPFDGGDHGIATREFPAHGLRAEFWHDQLPDEFGTEVPPHCTTDQVRFQRLGSGRRGAGAGAGGPEPIVLSEAMRDVDLFVSVTSVAADRNWQDGGRAANARLDPYWASYWDGELSATAEVRRDALARMLPGLAIADRLRLEDRWLHVRGELRAYKIHLGSGNILMAPADTYLCIVPSPGGAGVDRVFLPFDDDPTLSMILSKAFLLADDRAIRDQSIVEQIRRR